MASLHPTPERLQQFLRDTDESTPIVMINLLRYRERADYPADADAEPCSGREAYQRYGAAVAPMLGKVGARPVWGGSVASTVISPDGEAWDDAVLVEYPSRAAFIEMTSSPEYQAIAVHRSAGLADSRLIAATSGSELLAR